MGSLIADWKIRKSEEDVELHRCLSNAIQAGQVQVFADAGMLGHDGSPVHSPWDHLAPLLVLMSLALVILLSTGMAIGIVAMTLGALFHLTCNRYYVQWRLQERSKAFITTSLVHWQTVWQLGGVALTVVGTNEPACFAPMGDWRKFARRNLKAEGTAPPAPVAELAPVAPVRAAPKPPPIPEVEPPPPPPLPPEMELAGDVIDHAPQPESHEPEPAETVPVEPHWPEIHRYDA